MATAIVPREQPRANPTRRNVLRGLGVFSAGAAMTGAALAALPADDPDAELVQAWLTLLALQAENETLQFRHDLAFSLQDDAMRSRSLRAAYQGDSEIIGILDRVDSHIAALLVALPEQPPSEEYMDDLGQREDEAWFVIKDTPAKGPAGLLVKVLFLQLMSTTSELAPDDSPFGDLIEGLSRLSGQSLPLSPEAATCPPSPRKRNLPAAYYAEVESGLRAVKHVENERLLQGIVRRLAAEAGVV